MICKIYNFSHIFVWGSFFWFCIPSLRLRASSSHTPLCHTPLVTLHFVIHTHTPSFPTQCFTHISPTHTHIFVTQCHNLSCTSLSHTALSHTHTHLSHQSFVTHTHTIFFRAHLCHTTLSHTHTHIIFHYTTFHTQLCHAHTHTIFHNTSLSHNFVTRNFVTHNLILTVFRNTIFHTHTHTHTHLTFVTLTCHLCGRRGTWWHPRCFCVVGAALTALAGQFALLWLLKVPTCSQPRRLGGLRRFSTWCSFVIHSFVTHTQLFHTHTQLFHTHTQLSHTHNSFSRNSFAHNSFTQLSRTQLFHIQLFEISDPPPSPLSFLPSLFCFNHCFWLFGEVDLWVCPVL